MTQYRIFASPDDAEMAFYQAVAERDLDGLMAVWSDEEDLLCVHPTGELIHGHNAIRESWRMIFGSSHFRAEATQLMHWHSTVVAIHHNTEVLFVGDDNTPHGPLHVTHIFMRGAHGWRLVCRQAQASSEIPGLQERAKHTLH